MEEAQIVEDVEAPPPEESMQRNIDCGKIKEISQSMQHNTLWGNTNETNNFTIFRTPHNISQRKKNLFKPSVISIGPFHHGQKHLRAMEEQKWCSLRNFLSRGDDILDLCISEMILLEKKTRGCYSERVHLTSNAFVEMMLLDGCFVLEYFMFFFEKENLNSTFEVGWNFHFIGYDLLLLENQIPFFIVEKLLEIVLEDRKFFVKGIAFLFLTRTPSIDYRDSIKSLHLIPDPPAEIHHLVHLCYLYLVPDPQAFPQKKKKPKKSVVRCSKSFECTRIFCANRIIKGLLHLFRSRIKSTKENSSMVISSATKLKQSGLTFKPHSNPRHMLDISFENGVLKIPRLAISDSTKPIFANLLAFEHSKYHKKNSPFGRFVSFLDKLVNTTNDVTILQECGIIENWLGSEEELTDFFNQMSDGNFVQSNHYLKDLYKEVNRCTESSWHKHRAKLIRDYFSSPWAAFSLAAAIILLVLTFLQSFFAVYAYFRPPKS